MIFSWCSVCLKYALILPTVFGTIPGLPHESMFTLIMYHIFLFSQLFGIEKDVKEYVMTKLRVLGVLKWRTISSPEEMIFESPLAPQHQHPGLEEVVSHQAEKYRVENLLSRCFQRVFPFLTPFFIYLVGKFVFYRAVHRGLLTIQERPWSCSKDHMCDAKGLKPHQSWCGCIQGKCLTFFTSQASWYPLLLEESLHNWYNIRYSNSTWTTDKSLRSLFLNRIFKSWGSVIKEECQYHPWAQSRGRRSTEKERNWGDKNMREGNNRGTGTGTLSTSLNWRSNIAKSQITNATILKTGTPNYNHQT